MERVLNHCAVDIAEGIPDAGELVDEIEWRLDEGKRFVDVHAQPRLLLILCQAARGQRGARFREVVVFRKIT